MARNTTRGVLAATAATALLAGCNTYDPQLRAGLWHPTHPSHTNTVLMVANPADLVRGRGVSGSDGQLAAAAIDRLETNKVKKLPDAGLSDISVKSQGGGE
jgi:type IV pilus biogenesis protein CpaD/CtpE